MLLLYDNPASSNARKVRFALAELGLEAERIHVPLADERPNWYLEVHPFGTVPTLVDGDLKLVESNTILRYLADREGRSDLYPREPRSRARVDELLDVLSLAVRPALWDAELEFVYGKDVAAPSLPALGSALDGWERLIEGGGFVTGVFSIADCAACARLWGLRDLPFELERWPRTARMLETVGARPAFAAALSGQ